MSYINASEVRILSSLIISKEVPKVSDRVEVVLYEKDSRVFVGELVRDGDLIDEVSPVEGAIGLKMVDGIPAIHIASNVKGEKSALGLDGKARFIPVAYYADIGEIEVEVCAEFRA